jgi:hypothetical protein
LLAKIDKISSTEKDIFEIDRENPRFRENDRSFQNPGNAPEMAAENRAIKRCNGIGLLKL